MIVNKTRERKRNRLNMLQRLGLVTVAGAFLAACAGGVADYPDNKPGGPKGISSRPERDYGTLFGEDGLSTIFGGESEQGQGTGGGGGIGVNSFLWRASLDTLSFMPLQSADPFGGVIITDWYANPDAPDERFKVTVYILDRRLRADGIRVAAFRQTRSTQGWDDAATGDATAVRLENAILNRARQLRIDTVQ